ncbi:MAG: M28 family peptidase [Ignavibacteria bacterium]|nr:M28 family peptidase [Ignavibacteria bacterium]
MNLRLPLLALLLTCLTVYAQNQQTDWEMRFRDIPAPDRISAYVQRLSARPHHVGSAYNKDNAEWLATTFKQWGLETRIETFDVLFPTPKERLVELVVPTRFRAALQEPAVSVDPTSGQHSEQLPTYNAYSIDGDVTAPLVYVNYGIPEDYEQLERLGVSVKGCIVIARYGASWRGIKPKVAVEKGAVGCLIYSDPRNDGYYHGDVFPRGPWRPKDGVQRGSVVDMPLYPGDPLTPGVGATANAERLEISEAKTLTKIPVLPLSYADAQPLLAALGGPVAPEPWRGALPITYKIGPGPSKVHLKVKSNWDIETIYNVIVTIAGSVYPDEWIIRGNHHDAWVNGAQDPCTGLAAQMEELRALAELMKQGWRPKRTIIYCAWDAEEPGLLGSTEWAEAHADELKQKAVVYINTDSNGRGFLGVEGSHSLEEFINNVARDIIDPEKNIPVWKRSQLRQIANARTPEERAEARSRPDLRIGALGSGSDYTAFIDHLGIASLNLGYGGEDGGGIYHSIYDDFYWYTHFADTDFTYGRTLAQTAGTAVIRLADADLLPFSFTNFAETVRLYVDEVKRLLKNLQDETKERNRQIAEGVFTAVADPKDPFVPPVAESVPPHLNFAPLENALETLTKSADHYNQAVKKIQKGKISLPAEVLRTLNATLIQSERALLSAEGLPGRPWFKHMIYAPGSYTGYGVKTLPGVREAIEQKRWNDAEAQTIRVARVLEEASSVIHTAATRLESAVRR